MSVVCSLLHITAHSLQNEMTCKLQTTLRLAVTTRSVYVYVSESGWSGGHLSASHSADSDDAITESVPVAGVILKSECSLAGFIS